MIRKDKTFCMGKTSRFAALLVLLVCALGMMAQTTDYSGFWYMRNAKNGGQYYLVPAADPHQNPPIDVFFDAYGTNPSGPYTMPFLTTFKTNGDEDFCLFLHAPKYGLPNI